MSAVWGGKLSIPISSDKVEKGTFRAALDWGVDERDSSPVVPEEADTRDFPGVSVQSESWVWTSRYSLSACCLE